MSYPLDERYCRVCGCTEFAACLDPETGLPCHWVEDDLCSACLGKGRPRRDPPRPAMIASLVAVLAAMGAVR